MDTPERRTDMYEFHSRSSSMRHNHHHHHHNPYRRSEYFLEEFKKFKPPKFDEHMKKLENAEAWLLGMKNFFKLNNYSENMKAKIDTFSLKGKSNIW